MHNVVARGVLQAMWEELLGQVYRAYSAINSLSANHAYLKTFYSRVKL